MTDEQFLNILKASPKLLGLNKNQFNLWLEELPIKETLDFSKGVAVKFNADKDEFFKKLRTYQILKAKPWVNAEDIRFNVELIWH